MVLWSQIREFKTQDLWVLLRDFNATINQDERVGDRVRSFFLAALTDCELFDVPYHGCFYTWSKNQEPPTRIVAKLDRVLGNQAWMDGFTNAVVCFMPEGLFDHSPAVLSLRYQQCVIEAWQNQVHGSPMYRVVCKLKRVKAELKNLNKCVIGNIGAAFSQSEHDLYNIQQQLHIDSQNCQLIKEEACHKKTHERLQDAYFEFLRQKLKMNWLHLGDANTQVFHRSIWMRRLRNYVLAVRDEQGKW
ncbi:uncharacterized protein LOC133824822 [Humulus lupulus]|uniref:uncharacterized protein LOC133824822 n=1 Tax=Humulus lupulus TaxID=3486 RepID=UPI002B409E9A|nr:uncharacterized protein LOC133824822 [Humulus lupulus]